MREKFYMFDHAPTLAEIFDDPNSDVQSVCSS